MIQPCSPLSAIIDLRSAEQLQLLDSFSRIDASQLLDRIECGTSRYKKNNERYNFSDALVLHCMMRKKSPKRIIEIGCGMSSCMILDTNEHYFRNTIDCTFIDIDLSAFRQFCTPQDLVENTVIESPIQNIDIIPFLSLEEGDILFIDSSHIYAPGSDVFDLLHRILPVVSSGVYIHIHDIFHDFAYPKEWNNAAWNELEIIQSFLSRSNRYNVTFFSSYISHSHPEKFHTTFPSLQYIHGGSLWLQKI